MTIKLDELARCSQRVAGELGVHLDANETALFARQLEYVFAQPYNVEYPELKARQLVPVNYAVPTGADSHTYYQFDQVGMADYVTDYSTDFQNGDVFGKKFTAGVVAIGSSYQYTIQELRAAQLAKFAYLEMKAGLARQMIETKLDALTANGDANVLIGGLLKDSAGTNVGTVVTPGTTNWTINSDAVNLTIVADIQALIKSVWVNTLQLRTANTVLLSTFAYARLQFSKLNLYSDQTVLSYLQATNPGVQFIPWTRLDVVTAGSPTGTDIMFAYSRQPDVLSLIIPQEFEQFAPQNRSLAFVIPCHLRSGGVVIRYPKAFSRMNAVFG